MTPCPVVPAPLYPTKEQDVEDRRTYVRDVGNIVHFGVALHTDKVASVTLTIDSGVVLVLLSYRHVVAAVVVVVVPARWTR